MAPRNVFALLLLVLVLALPGSAGAQERQKTAFRILVPQSTSSLPLLRLADRDPLPGVDFQALPFVNHAQALAALLRGEAEALFTGTSQGWENYLDGGPLVTVTTLVWGVSSLVGSRDSGDIHGFAGLRGKRLALPFPGSPLDFQTRYLLDQAGLNPRRDVEILYAPFGQSVPLLLAGRLDAAALPEPLATSLVVERGLPRLASYALAWAEATGDPRSPQVGLFVLQRTATAQATLLQELVAQLHPMVDEVTGSPQSVAGDYAQALSVPANVLAESITYTLFYVPGFEENRALVVEYYELMREFLGEPRPPLGADFFFVPQ